MSEDAEREGEKPRSQRRKRKRALAPYPTSPSRTATTSSVSSREPYTRTKRKKAIGRRRGADGGDRPVLIRPRIE